MKTRSQRASIGIGLFIVHATFTPPLLGDAPTQEIEEIIVSADFHATGLQKSASSISVLSADNIKESQASHLSELLSQAPNLNYATGASRGRFIQIRGVGERSQFIEPLNPSVGVLLDGIDLSGVGGAATTLDLAQVEIFRGPQGTLFGANALAGLVSMKSNLPSNTLTGELEATAGEDGLRSLSGVLSGPLSDTSAYRVAIKNHKSDGHIQNDFLNRDDTNNLDELSTRATILWHPVDQFELKLSGYYVNIDNGYDAFSLDNTRHTLSDQPGHDQQESVAFALQSSWQATDKFDVLGLLSFIDSDLEYAFDEDWSFSDICTGTACAGWEYSSFDSYNRSRRNTSFDIRLRSTSEGALFDGNSSWVLGFYLRDDSVNLLRQYTFASSDFSSDYDTKNLAVYGQIDTRLAHSLLLSVGLRLEQREANYIDNNRVSHQNNEDLWGGNVSVEYTTPKQNLIYGLVSRGYKAGGVNSNPALNENLRNYTTEGMWNVEAGFKASSFDRRLQTRLALFYQFRQDMQVKQSLVEPISGSDCPCSFEDFLGNAAKGSNRGLELEINWMASDRLAFHGSLGLLAAQFDKFESFTHVDADPENGLAVDLKGRKQAHAPSYQYAFGGEYWLSQYLSASVRIEGKNKFKLSTRHEEQSRAYTLLHANVSFTTAHWALSLWARNLTDKTTIERGFGSFGNDPRKFYITEPYYQYGAPRVVGVSARYSF